MFFLISISPQLFFLKSFLSVFINGIDVVIDWQIQSEL